MAREHGLQSKGAAMSAMNPPVRLLAKLGSIVAHVDEGSGEGGHAYDWAAVRSLIADREVQEWLDGMRKAALLQSPAPPSGHPMSEERSKTAELVHNVSDRRKGWIGPWEVEPLDISKLTAADIGRTVIYRDHGRAEAGTLTSWRNGLVFARYSKGDTAAGADPSSLVFGIREITYDH